MAWLELLMCSLRESKFTEFIKLETLVKAITEPVEVEEWEQPEGGLGRLLRGEEDK